MEYFKICIHIVLLLLLMACDSFQVKSTHQYQVNRCPPYCDEYGNFNNTPYFCSSPKQYCCSYMKTLIRCCNDSSLDQSGSPGVFICPNSPWWLYNWKVAIGMLCGIIVMMVITAVCCEGCFLRVVRRRRRHIREASFHNNPISMVLSPPDYATSVEPPPSYADIFTNKPFDNLGFSSEESQPSLPRRSDYQSSYVSQDGDYQSSHPPPAYDYQTERDTPNADCSTAFPTNSNNTNETSFGIN